MKGIMMTDQQSDPDDTTVTDGLAEPTGNALTPDDPADQPAQDPEQLPPGTVTEGT